jgi:hypothetical protein
MVTKSLRETLTSLYSLTREMIDHGLLHPAYNPARTAIQNEHRED